MTRQEVGSNFGHLTSLAANTGSEKTATTWRVVSDRRSVLPEVSRAVWGTVWRPASEALARQRRGGTLRVRSDLRAQVAGDDTVTWFRRRTDGSWGRV